MTIGTTIDEAWKIKKSISLLNAEIAIKEGELKEIEERLHSQMKTEDTTRGAGKLASVLLSLDEVPTVEDWDKLQAYIKRHSAFHLLQKRVAVLAVRELWGQHKKVPGVVAVPQTKLKYTAIS